MSSASQKGFNMDSKPLRNLTTFPYYTVKRPENNDTAIFDAASGTMIMKSAGAYPRSHIARVTRNLLKLGWEISATRGLPELHAGQVISVTSPFDLVVHVDSERLRESREGGRTDIPLVRICLGIAYDYSEVVELGFCHDIHINASTFLQTLWDSPLVDRPRAVAVCRTSSLLVTR